MNEKKLMLKKVTISNLKTPDMSSVRGGRLVQAVNPNERPSDTCLCAPTYWEGCYNNIAVN